jgi:hypothetical protein
MGHRVRRTLAAALTAAAVAGCGGCATAVLAGRDGYVPEEVRTACWRPSAAVRLTSLPITVSHRLCDLTGVDIYFDIATVTVPARGTANECADGMEGGACIVVEVDPRTGDVTVRS